MNEPYLGQTTDMVLGQEFLTWLWFRSETQPMGFKDKELSLIHISEPTRH